MPFDGPFDGPVDGDSNFACVLGAWQAHATELRGYLARRVGDTAGAEDLLHDVFIRAMQEGQGFCQLDNPRAWMFRVARNVATDHERRQRATSPIDDALPHSEPACDPIEDLQQCLMRNLSSLAETDQDILRHCDLQGVRQSDYAARNDLSLSAVKSRLLRARQRLRDSMVSRCNVHFDAAGNICCHRNIDSA